MAVNDTKTTPRGTPVSIAVLANDTDANGDVLSVSSFTQPANGTVTFANGIATYTPRSGFTGTDTFSYVATDGQSQSNAANVTIQVNPKLTTYARTTAQSIPDNGVLSSTIVISDSFTISDINVTLDITHPRVSELQIFLRGPDGTVIQLFNGTVVSGQNLRNTVFDDEAATSITTALAPFTGKTIAGRLVFVGCTARYDWNRQQYAALRFPRHPGGHRTHVGIPAGQRVEGGTFSCRPHSAGEILRDEDIETDEDEWCTGCVHDALVAAKRLSGGGHGAWQVQSKWPDAARAAHRG